MESAGLKDRLADMLDIIQNNPYRLLGIYSNSPTRDRVANHNRLKAFLKVGKDISFPLDLPVLFPTINRTTENVSDADAKLVLPNEQLRYAQFWFVRATSLDDIAINHLIAGNVEMAMSIWEKKDNVSSLQNRIVYALAKENYVMAFTCAEKLYSSYIIEFINAVLGVCHTVDTGNLAYAFLDEICSAVDVKAILPYIRNHDWKKHLGDKAIKPLISALQTAINAAKASKGKGITTRYNAGVKLINDTKETLIQVKSILSISDLQYQMIADKLGLEILQCGIDYYNASEAADAAYKAMKLQAYALSVVVGKMAKDRCKENVDILQNIINNLPPKEVFAEDRAINEELRKYCQLPDKISYAVALLNNTKSHLQSIKDKLGVGNAYYLKISTQVVGNALHNVIEEVNSVQKNDNDLFGTIPERENPLISLQKMLTIKRTLEAAWNATKIMDTFDMDADFKRNRYNQNRSILKGLCEQLGVSTLTHVSRPMTSYSQSSSKSIPQSSVSNSKSTSSSDEGSSGCLILFIVWIIIGCIVGGICVANDGDFSVGFCISGVIVLVFSRLFDN